MSAEDRDEALFRAFLESAPDAMVLVARDGRIALVNERTEEVFGYARKELLGQPVEVLVPQAARAVHRDHVARFTASASVRPMGEGLELRGQRRDGSTFPVEISLAPLRTDEGAFVCAAVRDVTARSEATAELAASEARLAAHAGVLTRIATGEPLHACLNAACDVVAAWLPGSSVQLDLADTAVAGLLHPFLSRRSAVVRRSEAEAAAVEGLVKQAVATGRLAVRTLEEPGSLTRTFASLPLLSRHEGVLLGVLTAGVQRDEGLAPADTAAVEAAGSLAQIALGRHRDVGRLVEMALQDALTGLPNRMLLLDRLGQALAADARGVAVLFCDLDNFKLVNDTLGHSVGDRVLKDVADRLREVVRPTDSLARFGGDEFVVLITGLATEAEAFDRAQELVETLAVPLRVGATELVITASVGIAMGVGADGNADTLLAHADAALHRAKDRGRDRVEVFDVHLQERAKRRLDSETALRTAVSSGELVLHYQPQVDVLTGRTLSVEALVRWDRPDHGLVAPLDFVPLAEETGLIVPIGAWVLREACAEVARLGREGHRLAVAVNVSARQLAGKELAGAVKEALGSSGLPPEALRLEITESAIMEDVATVGRALEELTDLGVTVSIDDFGTGYSSLLYLRRLPVSELKVDAAFVRGLGKDPEDDAIVRGIVHLAQALGLSTVAEGVEEPEQLAILASLGCTAAQGLLFSGPLPLDQLEAWLGTVRHL